MIFLDDPGGLETSKNENHFVHAVNRVVPKKCDNAALNGFGQRQRTAGNFAQTIFRSGKRRLPPWGTDTGESARQALSKFAKIPEFMLCNGLHNDAPEICQTMAMNGWFNDSESLGVYAQRFFRSG